MMYRTRMRAIRLEKPPGECVELNAVDRAFTWAWDEAASHALSYAAMQFIC
jgi:hypothetical protein